MMSSDLQRYYLTLIRRHEQAISDLIAENATLKAENNQLRARLERAPPIQFNCPLCQAPTTQIGAGSACMNCDWDNLPPLTERELHDYQRDTAADIGQRRN